MTHYMFVFNAGSLCDVGKLTLIQPFSGFPKQTFATKADFVSMGL